MGLGIERPINYGQLFYVSPKANFSVTNELTLNFANIYLTACISKTFYLFVCLVIHLFIFNLLHNHDWKECNNKICRISEIW